MEKEELAKEIREHLKQQLGWIQELMTCTTLSEQQNAIYGIIFQNSMIKKKLKN